MNARFRQDLFTFTHLKQMSLAAAVLAVVVAIPSGPVNAQEGATLEEIVDRRLGTSLGASKQHRCFAAIHDTFTVTPNEKGGSEKFVPSCVRFGP